MSLSDDFRDEHLKAGERDRSGHPTGWEPGIDTAKGTLTYRTSAKPTDVAHDWNFILEDYGLDPSRFRVVEPVQVRSWDSNLGDGETGRLYYYRAGIERTSGPDSPNLDELVRLIRRRKPRTPKRVYTHDDVYSLVVGLADPQAGKFEGGGTPALVERLESMKHAVPRRLKQLRKAGVPVNQIVLMGMGDLVERCGNNWYAMQDFQTDLNEREQLRLMYETVVAWIEHWMGFVDTMVCAAVPGNHGELRRNAKAFTNFGDNMDLQAFEIARAVIDKTDYADRVGWVIPHNSLSLSIDVKGTIIGAIHGHQAGKPAKHSHTKAWDWWERQTFGAPDSNHVADAHVLMSAHFHYPTVVENGERVHVQCATLDGGSQWFQESYGATTPAGLTTFVTGHGTKVAHYEVLRP